MDHAGAMRFLHTADWHLGRLFHGASLVNDQAHVAPYGYEESSSFFSERMNAQDCAGIHPVYKNDWLLFCLK